MVMVCSCVITATVMGIKGVEGLVMLFSHIQGSDIVLVNQQPDQLDLFSPNLPLHDDRAPCGRPAHTYPYPSRPSSGVRQHRHYWEDHLDYNHDRNHDHSYTDTNTCCLPGTLPRLHGCLPMRLLLLILDLSTRRPQGRKVFLHSP
jgi:hypothetical protein